MNANPYDNVYLDRDGIVKPIVTSPAKSRDEVQVARVKQLKHKTAISTSSDEHDDVAFQRINRFFVFLIWINSKCSIIEIRQSSS